MFYVRLYRAGVFDDEKFILNEDSLAQMTISIKENQEKKQRLTEKKPGIYISAYKFLRNYGCMVAVG